MELEMYYEKELRLDVRLWCHEMNDKEFYGTG